MELWSNSVYEVTEYILLENLFWGDFDSYCVYATQWLNVAFLYHLELWGEKLEICHNETARRGIYTVLLLENGRA